MKFYIKTGVSVVSAIVLGVSVASAAPVSAVPVTVTSVTVTSQCPLLITSFMKLDASNNPDQVRRLQTFLKNNETLDVDVTGIFDQKTESAVEVFQKKYMSDIMGPWGATRPSGTVYLTTMKKINQLACGIPLSLNDKDMAVLSSYKKAEMAANDQSSQESVSGSAQSNVDSNGVVGTGLNSDMTLGPTMNGNSNSSGRGSVSSRFWNFLASFFQR